MKAWKTLESQLLLDTPFCKFRIDRCELQDGRVMPRYYVLDFTDWVNVVPVTKTGEIVLIKQYRHANKEFTWEIPGGAVHPNEDSSPIIAAKRELEEETGYTTSKIESLGVLAPNPALQSNKLHTFIAYDCWLQGKQNLDPFEEIEVQTFSFKKVLEMAKSGEFNHALMVASIFLAQDKING